MDEMDVDEEVDEMKKVIQSTVDSTLQNDKEELVKLLTELKEDADWKVNTTSMLVGDINENRFHVLSIFNRLDDAQGRKDMLTILKLLTQEGLLSDDQFQKLSELEETDLPQIASVILDTKIGQGLDFLPRTIDNLRKALQLLLAEIEGKGSAMIKNKLVGVLEELHRRGATQGSQPLVGEIK